MCLLFAELNCFYYLNIFFAFNIYEIHSGRKRFSEEIFLILKKTVNYLNKLVLEKNLINKYENGEEYIGKHSDDEKGLEPKCGVICVSYGAIRKFRIRDKKSGEVIGVILNLPG